MTLQVGADRYVGRNVPRVNDPKLLRGAGRFVDDIELPGLTHATILRSSIANAVVTSFDASYACEDEDVLLVLGPDEIATAVRPLPCVWLAPGQRQTEVPVASRELRYVGQPLGIVVGASRASAEDGADAVELDVESLPVVVDPVSALAADAPLLHREWGTNVCAEFAVGTPSDEIEAVMASAAHVVERQLDIQRIAVNPMETRGLVARWDPGEEFLTVWMSTQVPHHARDTIAQALGLRADQVRVIAGDVGGGFGGKDHVYPDEVMVCLAAMRTGTPVKWIEDRAEHLVATYHARAARHRARLALDADGRFLGIHSDIVGDLGAHPSNVGTGPFRISSTMLPGPYRFDVAGTNITAVLTNTTPTGAYRGFGMQEATWVRERLVDEAARELGRDPVELRLQNMLTPGELPCTNPTYQNYDSGDYPAALRMVAAAVADTSARISSRPNEPRTRRGVGYSSYVEFTGLGPSKVQKIVGFHLGGFETAVVRVEPDASVTVLSGVMGMGQGIETGLAQLTADHLRVSLDRVHVRLGDSATSPYSASGSIASRSMTVGGGAVVKAAGALHEKMLRIAAHQLEASAEDIELVDDCFRVRGDAAASLSLETVAKSAWLAWDLPEGESSGLEERFVHDPEDVSYAYATHAAAVAVDLDTGRVRVEGYWVAHDSGVLVNPKICDGQVIGGVAQGIGIALHEEMLYSEDGQPLTTTYLDYMLPLSDDVPNIHLDHLITPSPFIPGGMKGLGEGGTIGPPAAIGNAIAQAIPEIAGDLLATPFSPSRIWTLLNQAGLHDE